MGFKLTKTGKIILSERLILAEDIFNDVNNACDTLLAFLKKEITELGNTNSDYAENNKVFQQIVDKTNKLLQEIQNSTKLINKIKDPAVVKVKAKQYVSDVNAILDILDTDSLPTDFAKVQSIFDEIEDLATGSDFTKDTATTLKQKVEAIAAALDVVIEKNRTIQSGDDNISKGDYVNAMQHTYNDVLKLKQMAVDNDPLVTPGLLQVVNDLNNNASADNLKNFIKLCEESHKGNFGQTIAKSDSTPDEDENIEKQKAEGTDWAKEYEAAKNKQAFWDSYFTTYWGTDAQKIAALGDAYKEECTVLGFKDDTNPFIKFLKYFVTQQKYPITKAQYNAIHDSMAAGDGAVTKSDLENMPGYPGVASDAIDKSINPIVCKNFYTKTYAEARNYLATLLELKKQDMASIEGRRALIAGKTAGTKTDAELYMEKIAPYLQPNASGPINDKAYFVWVILYETADTTLAKMSSTPKTAPIPATPIQNLKLRNISDIKTILNALDITVISASSKAWAGTSTSNDLADDILADTALGGPKAAGSATAGMKTAAAEIIVTAATLFVDSSKLVNFLKNEPPADLSGVALSPAKTAEAKARMAKFGGTMKEKDVKDMISVFVAKGLL